MTHPRHELIPTIRSIGPALNQLRRLGVPSIFRPRPRHKFLVVTIPNLEARALAAICSRRAGSHGRRAMAEIFERGDEIRAATATRLLLLGRGDFEALERRDPDLHQHGMKLADMLLYAVPRGIDPGLLRSIAKDVFGVSPIPCAIPKPVDCSVPRQELSIRMYDDPKMLTIEASYEQLWINIYQELVKHLYDDALEVLAKNLGIAPRECAEQFGLASEFASTQNALRKLLLGLESEYSTERHQAWKNQVWHHLREHDRDGRWGPLIKAERGSQAVYAALLSRDVVTPVGRVHGRLDYPTARSRPFLSLAGDATKAALFAVVAAGYRLVAFEDGEFVVEIPATADLEARRLEVEHLAGRAAEVVLDGIPVPCKGEFRDRW